MHSFQAASKPTPKASSGGDLMADLHNKLAMRRKGISGIKEIQQLPPVEAPPNVMDRISAMIPPPPKPQANSSATDASDDDDWD